MSKAKSKSPDDLRSEHNMACPECGFAETLTVEISCSAILSIDGTEARGDHYWDDTSACFCDECGHNGIVGDFRVAETVIAKPNKEVQS
jgi:hypothetical protein